MNEIVLRLTPEELSFLYRCVCLGYEAGEPSVKSAVYDKLKSTAAYSKAKRGELMIHGEAVADVHHDHENTVA